MEKLNLSFVVDQKVKNSKKSVLTYKKNTNTKRRKKKYYSFIKNKTINRTSSSN